MPDVRYTIESDCDNVDPSRLAVAIHGEILEFQDDTPTQSKLGEIFALLVQRGRAMDENESLCEVMDSVDGELCECYQAAFQPNTNDWSDEVTQVYRDGLPGLDVLLIEGLEVEGGYCGKDVASKAVRETVATFGATCGLIVCRPSQLQYEDEDSNVLENLAGRPSGSKERPQFGFATRHS